MGTNLAPILEAREIPIDFLSNKALAVDSYNMLYQFLASIRQGDGSLLMNSRGEVTSHISGLFFRTVQLLKANIRLAFVFDGKPPELKLAERERRKAIKEKAIEKYSMAAATGDIEEMHKYASRTAILTKEMVNEAKELLAGFGLPVVQAPSEGEAQASYMSKKGEFYGVISQDTDSLLFGCPRVIRNVSITHRRKITGSTAYRAEQPEIIELPYSLNTLGIDIEQLIVVAMLCGTDFNYGGIPGIGPRKAIKLIKRHRKDFGRIFQEAKWSDFFSVPWEEVYSTIRNMPVTDEYILTWRPPDKKRLHELMTGKYEFSAERIEKALRDISVRQAQTGLGDYFR